ncbi:MAG: peroxidase-related enzyme [Cyclobacteriaceae bacterium]|nr:peroxidase-related enzyme [Cyclobacteriaceae bacterium]
MPHIAIPEGLPGIRGPLSLRPEVAKPLSAFMEVLMRDSNALSRGERELIAAYVSYLNNCFFCEHAHGGVAQYYLQCDIAFINRVKQDFNSTDLPGKIKALLAIAASVQKGGKHVTTVQIQEARSAGATDIEIHDVVLIAAAFCMFNRYTDGLNTWAPADMDFYIERAPAIAAKGYALD